MSSDPSWSTWTVSEYGLRSPKFSVRPGTWEDTDQSRRSTWFGVHNDLWGHRSWGSVGPVVSPLPGFGRTGDWGSVTETELEGVKRDTVGTHGRDVRRRERWTGGQKTLSPGRGTRVGGYGCRLS